MKVQLQSTYDNFVQLMKIISKQETTHTVENKIAKNVANYVKKTKVFNELLSDTFYKAEKE